MNTNIRTLNPAASPASLEDRIAEALRDHAGSTEIAALITEARDAVAASERAYGRAKEKALDPVTPAADVAEARRVMEDCEFRQERMRQADRSLAVELDAARKREDRDRHQAVFDEVKAERDVLVADLRRDYGPAAATIAALLVRIQASDSRIAALNAYPGGERLEPAECVAREIPPTFYGPRGIIPRLSLATRLPSFDNSGAYQWPR
jgi:hypothetical protein